MDKFKHVIGIIHTNYLSYMRSVDTLGQIKEPLMYYINQGVLEILVLFCFVCFVLFFSFFPSLLAVKFVFLIWLTQPILFLFVIPVYLYSTQGVCRAYCHRIIKLSGALQEFAAEKETICNVHGKASLYV
jgi:hypothetical protein